MHTSEVTVYTYNHFDAIKFLFCIVSIGFQALNKILSQLFTDRKTIKINYNYNNILALNTFKYNRL